MAALPIPNGVVGNRDPNLAPRVFTKEDFAAAISMLPNATSTHTCDSCAKEIGMVSFDLFLFGRSVPVYQNVPTHRERSGV